MTDPCRTGTASRAGPTRQCWSRPIPGRTSSTSSWARGLSGARCPTRLRCGLDRQSFQQRFQQRRPCRRAPCTPTDQPYIRPLLVHTGARFVPLPRNLPQADGVDGRRDDGGRTNQHGVLVGELDRTLPHSTAAQPANHGGVGDRRTDPHD